VLGLLTVAVFVLVSAATALIATRSRWSRTRVLARLASSGAAAVSALPSQALLWRELVKRIGAVLPAAPKDLPQVKRRLVRAGFRNPAAARFLQGTRLAASVCLGLAALAIAVEAEVPIDKLLMAAGAAAAFGYMAPNQYVSLRIARRQNAIRRGLPNALDLMVVCVEAGLGIDQTIIQVAKELQAAHPEICDEFTVMNLELRAGKRRPDALHNLADRTGVEDVKKLVAVLVQTDRFGTSVAQSLRGHADYLRTLARQRAEERAAKLAVKLVFPIFFCVLPSLFIVTLGPVLTRLIRDLLPMMENL
jgi:tight adherence protein C